MFSAPYVDQTFWQRTFSIDRGRVLQVFCKAAVLFALIPLLFGTIGFFSSGDASWNITKQFDGIAAIILALGVLCALISTLDSNLCAISSFVWSGERSDSENITKSRLAMVALIGAGSLLFLATNLSIVQWFLMYGTLRTCAAIPTVLVILNRYDREWLFYTTSVASVVATTGYALTAGTSYAWMFTVFGLLAPLAAYRRVALSN